MTKTSLRELISEIKDMQILVKKLAIYNEEEERFRDMIQLSAHEARLAQRCVQSYMDILLSQQVEVGDY